MKHKLMLATLLMILMSNVYAADAAGAASVSSHIGGEGVRHRGGATLEGAALAVARAAAANPHATSTAYNATCSAVGWVLRKCTKPWYIAQGYKIRSVTSENIIPASVLYTLTCGCFGDPAKRIYTNHEVAEKGEELVILNTDVKEFVEVYGGTLMQVR